MCGLKAKPELNGKSAKVGAFDAAKGRYAAQIDGGETLALKRENLVQVRPVVG